MKKEPLLTKKHNIYLTDAQLQAEYKKCEYCEEKPCKTACPVNCSPADFIMAAKLGTDGDIKRAALEIMKNNPLGGVCGAICPDTHCQSACVHRGFDSYVEIPAVQGTLIAKAKAMDILPKLPKSKLNGKKIAVIGAGPAGLGTAATLGRLGYKVTVFEREDKPGGAMRTIPEHRLPAEILDTDIEFLLSLGNVTLKCGKDAESPEKLAKKFDAVVVAVGLWSPLMPGIAGQDIAYKGLEYLKNPKKYKLKGNVVVIGGGATALDCAVTAKLNGARKVEMMALENIGEMPLCPNERAEILENGIDVSGRTSMLEIVGKGHKIDYIKTVKIELADGKEFSLKNVRNVKESEQLRKDVDHVIFSIGARSEIKNEKIKNVFYVGDCANGPTTVVEAVAAGKNIAVEVDAGLTKKKKPVIKKNVKSEFEVEGFNNVPVSLECDFFGRKIISPFILSAAPPTDGYEQMAAAYEAGWAGGIMKTTFHADQGDIHIPGEYMFQLNEETYANCDNVSGHGMARVVKEVKKLVKKYPDRLTIVSTGGPVSGNDEEDKKAWQRNTKVLEKAGVMGVEYSLSCPQGGDGTEGDIVAQNAKLTAKIIDWVMEKSDPEVPKLFKLTGAVTSIYPIANAIKDVFKKYPGKKGGITLANTFPSLAFRDRNVKEWDEGIVVGMSGEAVTYISNLNLANVAQLNLSVSGNGGPMDYKAAADFLALGAINVQFCTIVMKYGYGIIDELESGLSHLMQERGIKSVKQLIGRALPKPVTDFMELTPEKLISDANPDLCEHCGNCARCSYFAITYDKDKNPITNPELCVGCSICVQKCFSGALTMRTRTAKEAKMLKED